MDSTAFQCILLEMLQPVHVGRRLSSTSASSWIIHIMQAGGLHLQAKQAAPKKPFAQAKKAATQVTERHRSGGPPSPGCGCSQATTCSGLVPGGQLLLGMQGRVAQGRVA